MNENIKKLVQLLPEYEEKAVPRYRLALRMNMNDREMRKVIQAARDEGVCIRTGHYGGYFIDNSEAGRKAQARIYRAYALRMLHTASRLEKGWALDQEEMEEVE